MIGAFFAWWGGQLAELLPAWLRQPVPTRADALVIDPIGALEDAAACNAGTRRHGRETPLGRFALDADGLRPLPRQPRRPVVLRLAAADILETTLSLPLAAERDLTQVLAFEMDRETPFTADEVYWAHRVEAIDHRQARLSIHLTLVPRTRLEPLLAALGTAGLAPRWIEVAGAHEQPILPLATQRAHPERRSRRLVWASAACCAVLAAAAAALPFARQAIELAALDDQVRAGQAVAAEAERLRREIDTLSRGGDAIRAAREKSGRPLDVLATITRLLPDDTHLTEFDLRQRKLTIAGRSTAAARLLGAFGADRTFRNPGFSAPVTRVEALRAELFTIVAEVEASP